MGGWVRFMKGKGTWVMLRVLSPSRVIMGWHVDWIVTNFFKFLSSLSFNLPYIYYGKLLCPAAFHTPLG